MTGRGAATTDARGSVLAYSYDVLDRKTAEYQGSTSGVKLLGQLDRWLTREGEAGHVTVDGGEFADDPHAAATAASCWIDRAQHAAGRSRTA